MTNRWCEDIYILYCNQIIRLNNNARKKINKYHCVIELVIVAYITHSTKF